LTTIFEEVVYCSTVMLSNPRASAGEEQPLIKSVTPASMGKACFLAVIGALVCAWCVLDSWQRQTSSQLFGVSTVKDPKINAQTGEVSFDTSHPFTYPLTLAFFQFAFMGMAFLIMWGLFTRKHAADVAGMSRNLFSAQWGGLVGTHIFSTFWLQSLMMPGQLMSPALFAASRAMQVPAAAGFRYQIMGARLGGHPALTTAMMFGAGMLLIYAQSSIAECLCIWSGHGVELTGMSLIIIYVLVLALPAANTVCLESVMKNLDTNPFLMLATMNILACICCTPILGFAHFTGWENVSKAVEITMASRELYMLVLWLGAQMVLLSAVGLALIAMMDSFWTVALTVSFKAVFWWCSMLMNMYMSCPLTNVSIQHPNASYWGFIMLVGCVLVGAAAVVDSTAPREPIMAAKATADKV